MKSKKITFPSLIELQKKNNHLLYLFTHPIISRNFSEKNEILELQKKGFNHYIQENKLFNNIKFKYTSNINLNLLQTGINLEQQEYLINNNIINPLYQKKLTLDLNKLIIDLSKKLEIKIPKSSKKESEFKKETNQNILKPEETLVINENTLLNELVTVAKLRGEIKESILETTKTTITGQMPSSLTVALEEKTISNTISKFIENSELTKTKTKTDNKNTPKPEFNINKKKQINEIVSKMTTHFRSKQKISPIVLEEEKFETVLHTKNPIYINPHKDIIVTSILNMRNRNSSDPKINSTLLANGLEERKITSRLHS